MDIYIDNHLYNVGVMELKREFNIETKYDLTTEDGIKHREISGIYQNYSLLLGNINADTYDALLTNLTTADEFHKVRLPDGKSGWKEFDAFFDTITDELVKDYNGVRFWDNLTITFSAIAPVSSGDDIELLIDAEAVGL